MTHGRGVPSRSLRLWRARRRHHHIDAVVSDDSVAGWELTFLYDDRPLITLTFADRDGAVAEADRRLGDLLRAGWNVHW